MNKKINTPAILSIVAISLSAILMCVTIASCQKNERPVYNDSTVYETIKIYNGSSFIYRGSDCKILDYDDKRITIQNTTTGNKSTFYGENISLVAHEKNIPTTKTKETSEDETSATESTVESSTTSSESSDLPAPTVSNVFTESSTSSSSHPSYSSSTTTSR